MSIPLIFVLILTVCCLIFAFEKASFNLLINSSGSVNTLFNNPLNYFRIWFDISSYEMNVVKTTNNKILIEPIDQLTSVTNNEIKQIDRAIINTKKELNSNLKHLEFIMAIESPLGDAATSDSYTVDKLVEFEKVKKLAQLKVIELSNNLLNYQQNKINLC